MIGPKVGILAAAVLIVSSLVVGRCWQGRVADSKFQKLETQVAKYRADSAAFWTSIAQRTDTIKVVTTRIVKDAAKAESLSVVVAQRDSAMTEHLKADSAGTQVFAAFTDAVNRMDSLRLITIGNLQRIAATQDTIISGLRSRLVESDVMLSQAMGQLRSALARADSGWPTWRRLATAAGCVSAGVGFATKNATVGLAGATVCAVSLALP